MFLGGLKVELRFTAKILQNEDMDAACIEVPYDIKCREELITGVFAYS